MNVWDVYGDSARRREIEFFFVQQPFNTLHVDLIVLHAIT
jgi:hypothetical protein